MATHPTRVHADHDAEATVEVNDADDGEVEESLDVRFTRLLEIGELEKQVRRRQATASRAVSSVTLICRAAPRPRVHRSVGTARARPRDRTRRGHERSRASCGRARALSLRAFTHSRPTHAGEPGPWQPVTAHNDVETSGNGSTAREWAAWYRCGASLRGDVRDAARSAVFSQTLARVAQSTFGAQHAHAVVEVSVVSPGSRLKAKGA